MAMEDDMNFSEHQHASARYMDLPVSYALGLTTAAERNPPRP